MKAAYGVYVVGAKRTPFGMQIDAFSKIERMEKIKSIFVQELLVGN